MAEFVQQRIEEMLPELEQMERVGLFTQSETRHILKKRKAYEYKLRRRTKCKEDYLQYIQYEINLMALVKRRRKRIGYHHKILEIDVAIIQRIHKLFRLATGRFQSDVSLWLSHIQFCKCQGEKIPVSHLFGALLQVHNKKPDLWVLAADWEFTDNLQPDNARTLLQRGLRFNPQSKKLWLEYFRMELMYTEKIKKRKEILGNSMPEIADHVPDAVLEGKVALVAYQKASEIIPDDVDFALAFLPICRLFEDTEIILDVIYSDLDENFSDSEKLWNALARRKLHDGRDMRERSKDAFTNEAIADCCHVYDQAVDLLATECMWTFYLKTCMELIEEQNSSHSKDQLIRRILDVFQRASDKELLSADLFSEWATMLSHVGRVDRARTVLSLATQTYSRSVELWQKALQISMQTGDPASEADVLDRFRSAVEAVSDKESLPLWKLTIDYLISTKSPKTEDIFQAGIERCRQVSVPIKTLYIEWSYLMSGITKAREVYKRLHKVKPISLAFYKSYINMETSQAKVRVLKLRRAYEEAIGDFGNAETEVWIDYIKLELSHPNGKPENAGMIHFRALKTLDGELVQEFVTQYTLLQTGHMD